MENFSKNGRRLRPRKTASEGPAYSSSSFNSEKAQRPYGDRGKSFSGEHGKSYGDRAKSYNSDGSYSNHRSHGEGRPYTERTEHRSGSSERRPYGENGRPSYGAKRSYGENGHSSYGTKRSFGEGGAPQDRGFKKPGRSQFSRSQNSRRPAFKKAYAPSASEEGINRMISRKPVLSEMQNNSDNDYVKSPIREEVRLNKFIANSGVCSRREADTLIQAGVVTVNGEVVTELGTKVNIYKDEIKFNGERLKGEEKVYLVMNKPRGYVTTASDPHAEKTVMELLRGCNYRVFPVGRLDKNTTGVLMFTNDGELAEKLTHPSYDKKKIYQVTLDKPLQQEDHDKILAGVSLTDGMMAADELEYIDDADHRKLGIEIHSGKNRIVRRIFEALGYEVRALDRVYFAGLTKKGLKKGEWRKLSEGEVNILMMGAYV